jgi:hypothetical protein
VIAFSKKSNRVLLLMVAIATEITDGDPAMVVFTAAKIA